MEELIKNVQLWLSDDHDEEEKKQVLWLAKTLNYEAVDDAFFRYIGFGNRGIRGKSGIGFNRINDFTVTRVAHAFAQYLQRQFPGQELSVVLAYDNRQDNSRYCSLVSGVFSANKFKVHHFDILTPAPVLAYSIRLLACVGGVMFTGGKFPAAYNGIELYDLSGSPLSIGALSVVESYMEPLAKLNQVPRVNDEGKIEFVSERKEEYYLKSLSQLFQRGFSSLKLFEQPVVYTPLCGTGIFLGPEALKIAGVQHLIPVEDEFDASSDFDGFLKPDSHLASAYKRGILVAQENKAALIVATDSDCGRAGMAVQEQGKAFRVLKGHELALLLVDYFIQVHKEAHQKKQFVVVRDICTTRLLDKIAEKEGFRILTTSFNSEEQANALKREDIGRFTLSIDQEYGFYFSNHSCERDGLATAGFLVKVYHFWNARKKSIISRIEELYLRFGHYRECSFSTHFVGYRGPGTVADKIRRLRDNPFTAFPGFEVLYLADYEEGVWYAASSSEKMSPLFQPRKNHIHLEMEEGYQLDIILNPKEGRLNFFINAYQEPAAGEDNAINSQQIEKNIKKLKQLILDI